MTPIEYPKITGDDPRQQLRQLRGYLYQLVDQLNRALEQLERRTDDSKENL